MDWFMWGALMITNIALTILGGIVIAHLKEHKSKLKEV
jgi:hypothetical protein